MEQKYNKKETIRMPENLIKYYEGLALEMGVSRNDAYKMVLTLFKKTHENK